MYRLVSQGTLDELRYLRQLYKVQLKQATLEKADPSSAPKAAPPRMYRGVQGDSSRKGVRVQILECHSLLFCEKMTHIPLVSAYRNYLVLRICSNSKTVVFSMRFGRKSDRRNQVEGPEGSISTRPLPLRVNLRNWEKTNARIY